MFIYPFPWLQALNIDRVMNFPFPTSPPSEALEVRKLSAILDTVCVKDKTIPPATVEVFFFFLLLSPRLQRSFWSTLELCLRKKQNQGELPWLASLPLGGPWSSFPLLQDLPRCCPWGDNMAVYPTLLPLWLPWVWRYTLVSLSP